MYTHITHTVARGHLHATASEFCLQRRYIHINNIILLDTSTGHGYDYRGSQYKFNTFDRNRWAARICYSTYIILLLYVYTSAGTVTVYSRVQYQRVR